MNVIPPPCEPPGNDIFHLQSHHNILWQHIYVIKISTMINFKERIAGFNFKEDEIEALIGQSHIHLTEGRKGRTLVNMNGVKLMQLYTPISNGGNLEKLIADINVATKSTFEK